MIFRREHLGRHPAVFRAMTGLTVEAFDRLLPELLTACAADRRRRLDRPDRRRAPGGGDDFDLPVADRFLLTVVWLRQYPTQECLGYLFGVSDSTALRAVRRCLPLLEQSGQDSMRLPDPGRGKRRDLPALLRGTPELAVVIDTFKPMCSTCSGPTHSGRCGRRSLAEWRFVPRWGGPTRATDIACVPMSMGPALAAPSKRLSSRRSSIFKASGFAPAMPCHA
jgi:hypothetical protein